MASNDQREDTVRKYPIWRPGNNNMSVEYESIAMISVLVVICFILMVQYFSYIIFSLNCIYFLNLSYSIIHITLQSMIVKSNRV